MKCIICGKEIKQSKYSDKVLCSRECFITNFWNEKILLINNRNIARIDNNHYTIAKDSPSSYFKGHGGREFTIKFNSGKIVVTKNLWHQGIIPENFRAKLPNNAIFI